MAITQKATGILALQADGGWFMPTTRVITTESEIPAAWSAMGMGFKSIFARPCPLVPAHGFVDSRIVKTIEELKALWAEVKKVDPAGEIVLMSTVNATHNAIWLPGALAVGPGHDGATSGKDSIMIPLLADKPKHLAKLWEKAKIADDGVPYVEAVVGEHDNGYGSHTEVFYVQARSGEPIADPCAADFIPTKFTVKYVVEATGDLLEWKEMVEQFKPGTAVYHPGGTMASHYSVHCAVQWNKFGKAIPVLTTRKPKVGEVLKPIPVTPPDPEAVIDGIAAGTVVPLDTDRARTWAVSAIVTGLHHSSAMKGKAGFYIGVAAALMERLGLAAALGESRHGELNAPGIISPSRATVYTRVLHDLFAARAYAGAAARAFFNGKWSGGYGGCPWGDCTLSIANLDAAIIELVNSPSVAAVAEVVDTLNMSVTLAHNNGWWMNKFGVGPDLLDKAAKLDPRAFVPGASIFYAAHRVTAGDRALVRKAWAASKVERVTVGGKWAPAEAAALMEAVKIAPAKPQDAIEAHAKPSSGGEVHIQWRNAEQANEGAYNKLDVVVSKAVAAKIATLTTESTWSGAGTPYHILTVAHGKGYVVFKAGADVVAKLDYVK